ncbi:MAG TPA: septum formation initiator family protein [Candidatus Avilachnospira avistercoris]|nr:septum formation initiator family protein [Candidatus Avilachnospira avistercoris]
MAVRTGTKNRSYQRSLYVTEGNTVRVAEPYIQEPARKSQKRPRPVKQTSARPEVSREYRKNLRIGLPTVFMLFLALTAVIYIIYNYLYLTASIDTHKDNIVSLETRLEQLKNENDALEQSIDTSVDLNYVYDVAINELGMVHAGENNTIRYDKTESGYVRQYESITKN